MANSRRSAKPADPVVDALVRALRPAAGRADAPCYAVAWSGGLDSTVLLHAALAAGLGRFVALHVHHGLQPAADAWPAHCARQAAQLGVAFECLRVDGVPPPGASVEAWARAQRYRLLSAAARAHGAQALLTAHHADDQVETLLLRIARGTGVDGLAGIAARAERGGLRLLRPLLGLGRADLLAYAQAHGLDWVEDPSNRDPAHLRNAVRLQVLPTLNAVVPAFRGNLLRLAARLDEARDAIDALARIDLAAAAIHASGVAADAHDADSDSDAQAVATLDADVLAALTPARRAAALRLWLSTLGARAPSEARLREMDRQLLGATSPRGLVVHEGLALHRDRRCIVAERVPADGQGGRRPAPGARSNPPFTLVWRGQPAVVLPGFTGQLCFQPSSAAHGGVSADWLRTQTLSVRPLSTAARLRPAPGARQRTLKNLCQERDIAARLRPGLPLVEVQGRVLFAAGIGMDCSADWPAARPLVSLHWQPAHV